MASLLTSRGQSAKLRQITELFPRTHKGHASLTVLDEGLRAREPSVDSRHVQWTFAIFALKTGEKGDHENAHELNISPTGSHGHCSKEPPLTTSLSIF